MRAANLRVAYCQSADGKDYSTQKAWDSELNEFRRAQDQGIRPAGTKLAQTRAAVDESNRTGVAFDAGAQR